jgi:hypothetical protein
MLDGGKTYLIFAIYMYINQGRSQEFLGEEEEAKLAQKRGLEEDVVLSRNANFPLVGE